MKLINALLIAVVFVSCNDQISEDLTADTSSGSSTTTTTSVEGMNLNIANSSFMSYYIHEIGDPDEGCSIEGPFSAASPKTADCFLEVEELDLYLSGASITIGATAEYCEYVGFFPYFFYQYQPGSTDKEVVKVTCPANCQATCNADFGVADFVSAGTYYSLDSGATFAKFTPGDLSTSEDRCDYDYSDLDPAGPNCDDGEYAITTYEYTYDPTTVTCSAPATTPTPTTNECGGKKKACINGPIRDFFTDTQIETQNVTYEVIDTEDQTFEQTYDIASPFSKGFQTNMYVANYTKQCGASVVAPYYDADVIEDYATHVNLSDGTYQANDPFAVEGGTSPHYTFYCLNRSLEVMARIRLIVRDWDAEFSVLSSAQFDLDIIDNGNGSVGGSLGTYMDNTGSETTNSPIDNLQDRFDWDEDTVNRLNLDSVTPGNECTYPTATTSNSNGYFPQGDL